ncbi:hypothetical protein BKA80DRAFT_284803 [Phyllosticta citrichinensis]
MLNLHCTAVTLADLRALTGASSVAGPLEVPLISQSEIWTGREGEEHRFFTHKKSPLKTSLRKLGLVRCLTMSVPWLKVFKALRKYTKLEKILFEKIVVPSGVVQFDWDGDSVLDDGSRMPSIPEQMGLNATLNKMVQCCEIPSSGSPECLIWLSWLTCGLEKRLQRPIQLLLAVLASPIVAQSSASFPWSPEHVSTLCLYLAVDFTKAQRRTPWSLRRNSIESLARHLQVAVWTCFVFRNSPPECHLGAKY